MAGWLLRVRPVLFLFLINLVSISLCYTKESVQNVPKSIIQSALNSLNENSPTHHTYKDGNLISAQRLTEVPYIVYRLTFDLAPICTETLEPCPRETCTVEVKQLGDQNMVLIESIQCMYLLPQSIKHDELQLKKNQDQQFIENINENINLGHEVQQNNDNTENPFVTSKTVDSKYCPGCPYELSPNLPGLSAFKEQAAKAMDESTQNDFKHKIINIVRVTRTVLPSSNVIQYHILLRIGISDCLKNSIEQSECFIQLNLPIRTCLITFEVQPWQQSSRKITKNNCTMNGDISKIQNYSLPLSAEALLTSSYNKETSPEEMDALTNLKSILENDTYIPTVKSLDVENQEVTEHPFVKISLNSSNDDSTTAGFVDKIAEFNEFLKDFDLPTKNGAINIEENNTEVKEETIIPKKVNSINVLDRSKRVSGLVGAPGDIDVNDPIIKDLANKGLQKFSENSEGTSEPIVVDIVEATQQVVSGYLYKIKVKLGTSDCPKGNKDKKCHLREGSEIKECLFTIWSQPWKDNGNSQITINCDLNNKHKRSLKGSQYNQKMLKLAEEIKNKALFEDFVKKFKKVYSSKQHKQDRFKIFKQNLKLIKEQQTFERGTAEYGITMFADWTPDEFKSSYLGLRPDLKQENEIPLLEAEIPDVILPSKYDWRDYKKVTPVKNQGQCGSCWAFSAIGNVEGQYAIKHEKLLSLSEQELIDCDMLDKGCNGGYMTNAYKAIEALGGVEQEADYPYDARDEKCNIQLKKIKVQITSAVNITSNETSMAQWLVKNGPISVGINANAMQFYIGGVSHPFRFLCDPKDINHGVLIVGYGMSKYPLFHKELPYWIIKNSWGHKWGEHGYYRVYRGDGTCGVNTMASSAIVK